jgi:hypothetical protein
MPNPNNDTDNGNNDSFRKVALLFFRHIVKLVLAISSFFKLSSNPNGTAKSSGKNRNQNYSSVQPSGMTAFFCTQITPSRIIP